MVTEKAYGGYAQMRLAFLEENRPETLARMSEDGTLDGHLSGTDGRVNERRAQLEPFFQKSLGMSEELKALDWGRWAALAEQAQALARERAVKEVVEEA